MDTVTLLKASASTDAGIGHALPPESPMPMPQQSLWIPRKRAAAPGTGPGTIALRRSIVFAASLGMTGVAAYEMYEVVQVGGLTFLEGIVLGLFVVLFAWIALSFISTLVGFVVALIGPERALGIDTRAPLPKLASRTALLLPTYNEVPHRVASRLQAIYEQVEQTGRIAHFDFYVLSDSTDPDVWLAEEAAFLTLRERTGSDRIYYRHRSRNIARKSGNIGEWVRRFGGRYDHMLGRFGYECPAVGFAFDVGRVLAVMESQGVAVALPGPDFFIIDFTREKTAALSLARRLRDRGASVARDILTRELPESLDYARAQRARRVLVVGSPRTEPEQLLVLDLAGGGEQTLSIRDVLEQPHRHFADMEERGDA